MPTGFEYMDYLTGMRKVLGRYYILNNNGREDITDKLTEEAKPIREREKLSRELFYTKRL